MAISGLSPGHEYSFRVFAENVYGRSLPSEETEIIKTKDSDKKVVKKKQYEGKSCSSFLYIIYVIK